MFLGLRGICVKSHGGTDARGFSNAVGVAVDLVRQGFNDRVKTELQRFGRTMRPEPVPSQGALTA
jgi:glycerol-3-phosphate acyltransferase PlsX